MAVTWKKLAYSDDVILEAFMAAKGDLISASANDTPLILSVGANGTVLTANSATATGLEWGTAPGTGDVTAAAVLVDHTLIRGDGGVKGVQDTGITVDDSDNVSGMGTLACGVITSHQVTLGTGDTIVGDDTKITITSGAGIELTATTDVIIPANVGITFGTGEKIEGDDTNLTVTSGGAINLTAVTDVVIPANVGVTFGTGEKIEGDDTDLTVTSGGAINLTAVTDVVIPANVGVTFGTGEKIEGDDTDLTVTSGADIGLTATGDVNIPANVGITFGDDGEKIEGDGTDLTVASSGVLNLNSTGALIASHQAITDNHVVTIDGADIADDEIARFTASGLESRTPAEIAATMALDDIGDPDAAVDFNLQQATDLVVMTVANEAALPIVGIAVGQLCFATGELSLHICTVAA